VTALLWQTKNAVMRHITRREGITKNRRGEERIMSLTAKGMERGGEWSLAAESASEREMKKKKGWGGLRKEPMGEDIWRKSLVHDECKYTWVVQSTGPPDSAGQAPLKALSEKSSVRPSTRAAWKSSEGWRGIDIQSQTRLSEVTKNIKGNL